MNQHISALMDGELFEDEADALFDQLKNDPGADEDWRTFHLISDALRQPDHIHVNISPRLHERLQAEPTILAPRSRTRQNARWFALSAAASVLALTLVAWMSLQVGSEPAPQMAMQQTSSALKPASFSGRGGLNDYLMAHQEYSPSADVQGAASYMHTVAGQ